MRNIAIDSIFLLSFVNIVILFLLKMFIFHHVAIAIPVKFFLLIPSDKHCSTVQPDYWPMNLFAFDAFSLTFHVKPILEIM